MENGILIYEITNAYFTKVKDRNDVKKITSSFQIALMKILKLHFLLI